MEEKFKQFLSFFLLETSLFFDEYDIVKKIRYCQTAQWSSDAQQIIL